MRLVSILLSLVILIIGGAFAALNAKSVEINYLIGIKALPLAGIILLSLTIGILISFLIIGFKVLRLKSKNKWLEYKLKHMQEALEKTHCAIEKP